MIAPARIFLSYARQDRGIVEDLYRKLFDAGFRPWMDKDILAGELWKSSIQRAVQSSHFFLACLSKNSVSKRGYLQKEIKFALDIWQGMLEEDIYLVPVRLEDCEVPVSLREFQWVNLFEPDGWERLVNAIRVGMERRGEIIQPIDQESGPSEPDSVHEEVPPEDMIMPEVDGHLPDVYALYEDGLSQLLDRIGQGHPGYPEALVYRQRLAENIAQSRRYGDTATRKAERAEIIDQLNAFALPALGVSFSDLCGLSLSTTGQEPPEHLQQENVERRVKDGAEYAGVQAKHDSEQRVTVQEDAPAMTNESPSTSEDALLERSEVLYKQGLGYLHCRSLEEANASVAALRELIGINPEYKDAHRRLDEAKEKAKKLGDLEDRYRVSKFYFDRGRWEDAVVHLKSIADWDKQFKDVVTLLAEAEKQLKLQTLYANSEAQLKDRKWEEAIATLEEVVGIDQTYKGDSYNKLKRARAQYRLQSLYEQVQDHFREEEWPQAMRKLRAILRKDPDYPDAADRLKEARRRRKLAALYRDGIGFQGTSRWEEAIEQFTEIIRLARVYKFGKYKDVVDRLSEAQRQQELDRRFKQGGIYRRQGKWEEAVKEFEQVVAMEPNYRDVQSKLAECNKQRRLKKLGAQEETSVRGKDWPKVVEVREQLLELVPEDTSIITRLEEAKKQLRLDSLYREAMECIPKKRWRKAKAALGEVISLNPGYRDAETQLEAVQEHLSLGKRVREILKDPQWLSVIVAIPALIVGIIGLYPVIKEDLLNPATPTPRPTTLCNGNFDNGLACWQHGGELRQDVKCEGGQCYAVLGSPDYKCAGGVPVGEAWIKQSFQVPETVSPTLSLRYRVLSYDVMSFDFFQVSINGTPVNQFGNAEGVSDCNREVWDSGWQSVELDLSPYIGEELVEVSLRNFNKTHEWWNTWTYVDDIEVH